MGGLSKNGDYQRQICGRFGPRNGIRQCKICVMYGIESRNGSGEEVSNTTSEPQLHYNAVRNWYHEACT